MNTLCYRVVVGIVTFQLCIAHAQTDVHRHDEIEELIVTSTPLGDSASEIAQPVSVISGDKLKDKKNGTIGETLAGELGVSASDFGQAVGRPVIRGLVGPRVRVLESGIGSMDLSSLSADHAVGIEPFHAEKIEVLRGPSTLLYGSGAIGGVINVINNRIPAGPANKILDLEFQALGNTVSDERTQMLEMNGGRGRFAWHLDALNRQADDYKIPGFAESGETRAIDSEGEGHFGIVKNSDIDMSSLATGFSYSGDSTFFGLSISRLENNYGLPGEAHSHSVDDGGSAAEEEGPRLNLEQTRFDIKGQIDAPMRGYQRLTLRAGKNDYQHAELEEGDIATVFSNDETEARLELIQDVLANWEGALGLQYNNRRFSAIGEEAYIPPVDSDALGLFILEHRHWVQWNLEMGVRFENHQYNPSGNAMNRDFSVASYSAGVVRNLDDEHAIGLSLSRSERAPSTEELFSNGPHLVTHSFERGNTYLEAEVAANIDFSLRRQNARLSWQINLFRNNVDHYIFLQSQDQDNDGVADRVDAEGYPVMDEDGLLLVNYVQQKAEFRGMEAELVLGLMHNATSKVDLKIFTDFVKGELKNAGKLPRITPERLGAGLSFEHYAWRFGVDVLQVEDQNEVAVLETASKGYTLVNATATCSIPWMEGEMDVFIKGKNLSDEEARRHTSFLKDHAPLPGRALEVGLRASF